MKNTNHGNWKTKYEGYIFFGGNSVIKGVHMEVTRDCIAIDNHYFLHFTSIEELESEVEKRKNSFTSKRMQIDAEELLLQEAKEKALVLLQEGK